MPQLLPSGRVIRFGLYEIDLENRELRKEGVPTKLQGRPFEVLSILVEQPGRVVTREEFRQRLWPSDTFVDFDHSLNVSISKLRQALSDSADNPRFIATMGRRGYRFIAPAETLPETPPPTFPPPEPQRSSHIYRRLFSVARKVPRIGIVITMLIALGLPVLIGVLGSDPPPQVTRSVQLTHSGSVFRDQLVTDGPRLYFRDGAEGHGTLQQISVEGGDSSPVAGIPNLVVDDLSLRTSELLLVDRDDRQGSLWAWSLITGGARRLGNMKADAAAWSLDGSRVAYSNGGELYVADSNGGDGRKLLTLPRAVHCLRWSPDGTRLRFLEEGPKPQENGLWEVRSDGHGLHPLLPGWTDFPREGCGNWTADGRYFFFESSHEGVKDIWAIQEKKHWFSQKSSQLVRLTSGPLRFFSPISSRDRDRLFVVGEQRRGELTRYDEKSKKFEPFLAGISVNDLQFSHDRKWIVYVTFPDRVLWKSQADGSKRLQLTTPPMQTFLPSWSPDDQEIVFHAVSKPNQPWKIYLIHPVGGAPELLVSDPDSQESGGTWAPNGKAVAYTYDRISATLPASSSEIRILDLTTKRVTTLPGSSGLYAPEWSPDGRYVAALGEKDYLQLFDTEAQKWTTLLSIGVGYPSWSRDGRYIYCNSLWRENPALIRVAVPDGRMKTCPVNFLVAGTYGAWSGLTPDGSFLLLRDRGSRDIYSLYLNLP